MKEGIFRKNLAIGIILIFITASITTSININNLEPKKIQRIKAEIISEKSVATNLKASPDITVEITRPLNGSFYWRNTRLFSLPDRVIVYGPIDITVNASADAGIDRVEFYIDGNLRGNDSAEPYSYNWRAIICFQHTIKVVAYDKNGNKSEEGISVFKWRVHPLLVMSGSIFAVKPLSRLFGSRFLSYTIIKGTIFNMKKQGFELVFRAIRLRYTEYTHNRRSTGIIKLKKCSISRFGINRQIHPGPLGSVTWIYGIHLGCIKEI